MSAGEPLEMTDVLVSDTESSGSEMDEETGLTKRERRRRQQRDQLDHRLGGPVSVSTQEAKMADRDVVRKLLVNSVLILLWYFFSLSISIVSQDPILPT